jgi:aryl-alcohol dehydrogenase-like predicted oxidoreductase
MNTRLLGRSGIETAPLGMGCWAIGGVFTYLDIQAGWGEADDHESIRAIHAALDHGLTLFDTAAAYGTGHSERVLGKALAGKRDRVLIATKFGFRIDHERRHVDRHPAPAEVVALVRAECEGSLQRLDTDVIDLFQLHDGEYPVERVPELLDALESLVAAGKVRTYGWSTDSPTSAAAFAQGAHCVAIQHDLNVVLDAGPMLDLCDIFNLASVNRTPLARGALTGKYTRDTTFAANDVRNDPWARDNILRPAFDKLEALREILTSGGRTLAQGALAWIWARSPRTLPIAGMRSVAQVVENAGALAHGPLTEGQMREIDALLGRTLAPGQA